MDITERFLKEISLKQAIQMGQNGMDLGVSLMAV